MEPSMMWHPSTIVIAVEAGEAGEVQRWYIISLIISLSHLRHVRSSERVENDGNSAAL